MRRNRVRFVSIAGFALLSAATSTLAVEPGEQLGDPALESRARAISREIRCVVCQSENIDDSTAMLAGDLRLLIRERLTAGDTNEEVVGFLVERYGDYVLLKPRVQTNTLVLWAAPAAAAAAGALALWFALKARRGRKEPTRALTEDEIDALRRLD